MKKHLIFSLIFFAITFLYSTAHAQNASFYSNMTIGSNSQEVATLQNWLISNGYDIPAISSGQASPGYFGLQTKLAVQRYQAANGVPSTGYVGPLTRGRLNGMPVNVGTLTVLSPNGGESWMKGTNYTISWRSSNPYNTQSNVSIYLVRNISGCFNAGTRPCLAVVDPEYLIASNVYDNGSYNWNIGNEVSDGSNYFIKICRGSSDNRNSCDTSNAVFSVTAGGSSSQGPIIQSIDAPTTLSVGQTGTWTIRASDPNNGTLSYSVDWGDYPQVVTSGYSATPAVSQFTQSSTFTHSYSSVGTYTVRFNIRNGSGQSTQTSTTVQVGNVGSTAGPLRIISPNGGETWRTGTAQTITWTSPYYIRATYADLKLAPYYPPCTTGPCPMYAYRMPYTIASNLSINQNSYSWIVGNVQNDYSSMVPDGQYKIQICEVGSGNCEESDYPFTISNFIPPPPSNWNVICPAGYTCTQNW